METYNNITDDMISSLNEWTKVIDSGNNYFIAIHPLKLLRKHGKCQTYKIKKKMVSTGID